MSTMNRIANVRNHFQGTAKRVLCVCSAGLLRSPTAAEVLSRDPFNFNTRAAGAVSEYALVPVDEALIAWADQIVCMEQSHHDTLKSKFNLVGKSVVVLEIPDVYAFRAPELQAHIMEKYQHVTDDRCC